MNCKQNVKGNTFSCQDSLQQENSILSGTEKMVVYFPKGQAGMHNFIEDVNTIYLLKLQIQFPKKKEKIYSER